MEAVGVGSGVLIYLILTSRSFSLPVRREALKVEVGGTDGGEGGRTLARPSSAREGFLSTVPHLSVSVTSTP